MKDPTANNAVNPSRILVKSKEQAIAVIEPMLFDIYGRKTIESERPYIVERIDNYWILLGSLPVAPDGLIMTGGTFEAILDARTAEVLRIIHTQ